MKKLNLCSSWNHVAQGLFLVKKKRNLGSERRIKKEKKIIRECGVLSATPTYTF
jgi:hypothetical protein